jgi:putative OPT family oligopeptide transporter
MLKNSSYQTFQPSTYRELTISAVVLGILQGIILNIAFVYIALKLGFSLGGSAIAAIFGYLILRGILHRRSIVENNLNQTIASGINSAGTGVVFVVPAMFLLSVSQENLSTFSSFFFSFWPLMLAGLGGALLGVILIIPLRKQLIELERLRFPTGIAVATIIRSGSAGVEKAKLLGIGFLISALWKLLLLSGWMEQPGFWENEELNLSFGIIPSYFAPALSLSIMNFAIGILAGRAGLPFFFGGLLGWWIISPFSVAAGWTPPSVTLNDPAFADALVDFIYKNILQPLGIGILIGAALMEVIMNYPAIKSAFHALASATRHATTNGKEEMPFWLLLLGGIMALLFFFWAVWGVSGVSLTQALLVALLGTLWLGLAGLVVAQCTGLTDISPVSGISLISITIMMALFAGNVMPAMIVTVAVAVAIGQSADMMQDLKTGFLVGSNPFKQQIVQLAVSWLGVLIAFVVVFLLWSSGSGGENGFGAGTTLPAPQATVLTNMIEAVQNDTVPSDKFILGGIVGILLGAAPISGLGVLIGLAMYLPFSITLGYGLGCLTQMWIIKQKGPTFLENKLVPLAAGLIVGEALMGVGHASFLVTLQFFSQGG